MIWLRRFALYLLALIVVLIFCSQAITNSQSEKLPASISKYLDSLQHADNLEQWLLNWKDYITKDPVHRISFYDVAQSKIWRKSKTDDERIAWLSFLIDAGYYEKISGNILQSINSYEKAYGFYFEDPIREMQANVIEYLLKPLGNNYTRLGDYERAMFIQQKGLTLSLEQEDHKQSASFYGNLAITATSKGDLQSANNYAEEGLKLIKKDTSFYGFLLSVSADALLKLGDKKKSETRIKQAIDVLKMFLNKEENAPYWMLNAYLTQGEILEKKETLSAALNSYNGGVTFYNRFFKGRMKREFAKLQTSSGNALLKMNQPQEAIVRYNKALTVLIPSFDTNAELPNSNELYGENTLLDAINGKAKSFLLLNKKKDALKNFMLLFVVQRKLRYEFFSTQSKEQQQKEDRQWTESAMETAYDLWKETGNEEYEKKILLIAEMSKSQLLLDELRANLQYNRVRNKDSLLEKQFETSRAIAYYEKESILNPDSNAISIKKDLQYNLSLIQKQVREKYPNLEKYIKENELPATENLLQNIPEKTCAIEFFMGEKNIYIIRVVKNSITGIQKISDAQNVRQSIHDFSISYFQAGSGNKMMNDPEKYYKEANKIYNWLWPDKISSQWDHYMIIPDGIIGYLPFDALITDSVYKADNSQWPFLIKRANIFSAYSLQTWQQQQKINYPNKIFAGFFISFDSSSKASIPAVKKEYNALSKLIDGNFFSEKEASLKSFQEAIEKVNLLHISTHSFLQGQENMPVLQLADDKFFLFELYGQSFQPQLVSLSACRTGYGMLAEGEGIISLARGFTAAGAGGIVAGLWNMNDESTAELMGNFYEQLIKNHRPADALHFAKLQWLEKSHDQNFKKLPYFWAGLIYAGNNQPINISEKSETKKIFWWIGGGIIVVFFVRFFLKKRKRMAA
jgi:CHAT domain-containing protein